MDEFAKDKEYFVAGPLEIKNLKRRIKILEKNETKKNKEINGMVKDLNEIKEILRFQFQPAARDTAYKTALLPTFPLKKLKFVYDKEKNVLESEEYKEQLVIYIQFLVFFSQSHWNVINRDTKYRQLEEKAIKR